MFLYGYLKEWWRNSHWSISCCLGLLLPLNDLQGEIRGFAETNVFKNQLKTGQIDEPKMLSAVDISGAIEVTLEKVQPGNDKRVEIGDENYQGLKHKHVRRHQGTQTELCLKSFADMNH